MEVYGWSVLLRSVGFCPVVVFGKKGWTYGKILNGEAFE